MGWTPPTEPDFNEEWITPKEAIELMTPAFGERGAEKWVLDRLKAGILTAVARSLEHVGKIAALAQVPRSIWPQVEEDGDYHFWNVGDFTYQATDSTGYGYSSDPPFRLFDIRFDPQSFDGKARDNNDAESLILTSLPVSAISAKATARPNLPEPVRAGNISTDEAERFSRAVLAGWPEATEAFARDKALAFFPDKKVPKGWFLEIFRVIRGHRNRGVQPKNRD